MRWYFNIKKIIISIISIFLCILSVCQFTQAEDDYEIEENLHLVVDNKITSESNFEMSFTIPDMDFYPFIFNHRNEWEISEVLGKTDCSDGYLYSKDLKTGIIRKLVDQKIDNMYETKEGIYFIYGNTLFFVDYLGSSLETIYSSKHGLKKGNHTKI